MPHIQDLLLFLKEHGFLLFCVTNQPDIARGILTMDQAQAINDYLWVQLPEIVRFEICAHDDPDECPCRKPKAGMLIALAREFNLNLSKCWMIGDRWRDIGAGQNAGCKTIYFNYRNHGDLRNATPDFSAKTIQEVQQIFERNLHD